MAKALDTLSRRLSIPVADLKRWRRELSAQFQRKNRPAPAVAEAGPAEPPPVPPIRAADLDPLDRELVQIALNDPAVVARLITRVMVASLGNAPLRAILQASYDIYGEGEAPTFDRVISRLGDPALRALAAELVLPFEIAPLTQGTVQSPLEIRLAGVLARFEEREFKARLRDLKAALAETDPASDPIGYRALNNEYYRLFNSVRARKS